MSTAKELLKKHSEKIISKMILCLIELKYLINKGEKVIKRKNFSKNNK